MSKIVKRKSCPQFFFEMTNLMSDENFRQFFDKYFNDWNDVKTVIMFMKTYQFIENEYIKKEQKIPDNNKMAIIIRNMISDSNYRQFMAKNMINFIEGKPIEIGEFTYLLEDK